MTINIKCILNSGATLSSAGSVLSSLATFGLHIDVAKADAYENSGLYYIEYTTRVIGSYLQEMSVGNSGIHIMRVAIKDDFATIINVFVSDIDIKRVG